MYRHADQDQIDDLCLKSFVPTSCFRAMLRQLLEAIKYFQEVARVNLVSGKEEPDHQQRIRASLRLACLILSVFSLDALLNLLEEYLDCLGKQVDKEVIVLPHQILLEHGHQNAKDRCF